MDSTEQPKTDSGAIGHTKPQQLSETGQRLFECLSLGLVVFDHQLEIVHQNPAAEFLVGARTSIAEALSAKTVDTRYENWPEDLRKVLDSGHQRRFDQVLYRDDQGNELLLNLLCIALTDETGTHVTGGTLVIEDVTAAVSMEQRLAVSERMAAVGKLAARVAHELNNPLDGILRYLNLAIRAQEIEATDKLGNYLEQARGGLLRMAEIIRELVEFSRSAHTAFDDSGINTVVEEAIKVMSGKAVANGVSTVCTFSEGIPAIRGTNLFQVCCNLIKNAIDAMPDGGTLSISTQIVGQEVVIRFEDTGIGLPDEVERIFEPFFTTKEAGKGTGLGLAICKDIIEKHNGKITAERRKGSGTLFTVRLPRQSCATIRPAQPSPLPASQPAKEKEK